MIEPGDRFERVGTGRTLEIIGPSSLGRTRYDLEWWWPVREDDGTATIVADCRLRDPVLYRKLPREEKPAAPPPPPAPVHDDYRKLRPARGERERQELAELQERLRVAEAKLERITRLAEMHPPGGISVQLQAIRAVLAEKRKQG